ncbi:6-hydroxynicotinate 3-monooxygenase precursor [Legionella santicrucis]|uniref:6-hydroxynicotinate 3-monooxygenase n=1 Tax=Legionella santicrucis TaxID=45074 RepID=A0A0W0YKK8_9GAMM|nr:NAD(P)-binding protein [Legionella santicrucis]KTD57452.1 6-hydroxynicotinate 3-monooxygenase precursor [Legionella santicrucis]
MNSSIGIIGGSISALSAAIELKRKGFAVTLFERNKETFESRGAGIVLPKSIFEQKIKPDLLFPHFPYVNIDRRSIYTKNLNYLSHKKPLILNYPFPMVAIHWGHLYFGLKSQFQHDAYHAGEQVIAISQDQSAVYLKTNQGDYTFDYVIGADGVNSFLRHYIFPHLHPTYAGYTGWRGICEDQTLSKLIEPGEQIFYLYPGGHIVLYNIPASDYATTQRSVINWVFYEYDPKVSMAKTLVDKNGKPCNFSIPPSMLSQEQLKHVYDLAQAYLPAEASEIVCASETVFAQAIYDLLSPSHVQERCILLGDSATILRPHASSGSLKAIEGAMALSEALNAPKELRAASLAAWNATQVKKANDLMNFATSFGDLFVTSSTDWSTMDELSIMSLWKKLMEKAPQTPQLIEKENETR